MDSITHIVAGAAIGHHILGKKIGRKAAWIGAFLNTFPDFDLFISGLKDPRKYLIYHRAHSHAFFFELIYGLILAGLFYFLFRKRISYKQWAKMSLICIFTHSLLDICTNYGTRLFLPFSDRPVAWNNMAILDLFLTIPILIMMVTALFFKNNSGRRVKWVNMTLFYILFYFSFSFINKARMSHLFKKSLKENHIAYRSFMSNPTILNNFLWYGIAENEDSLYITEYSWIGKGKQMTWWAYPRNLESIRKSRSPDIRLLNWFSQGFSMAEQKSKDTLDYYAVKFGRNNFETTSTRGAFVFHYRIYKENKEWKLGFTEPRESGEDFGTAFKKLFYRILHNE